MAARLSTYLDLLYQDLIRGRQLGRCRRLPPVQPLVLYNGRRRWTAPTDLAHLIEAGPPGLEMTRTEALTNRKRGAWRSFDLQDYPLHPSERSVSGCSCAW